MDQIEEKFKDNIYFKQNPEMFKKLVELVEKNPTGYGMKFKHLNSLIPLKQWIINSLPLLQNEFYTMPTRIFWIFNDFEDFLKCPVCGKSIGVMKNVSLNRGYPEHCSIKCRNNDEQIIKRQNETLHSHLKDDPEYFAKIEQKKKNTKVNHGHDPNWTNSEKAKETVAKDPDHWAKRDKKTKQTLLDKYGDSNYINVAAIQQTMLERYGVINYTQTEEYREKLKKTSQKKYGCDNPNQSSIVKQHKKEGSIAKYGVDHPMKSEVVKKHFSDSFAKKYDGAHWPSQVPIIRKKSRNRYMYDNNAFDSVPELAFYIWLKDTRQNFVYKPLDFFEYQFEGKMFRYFPDFKVDDKYIEIKGDHFFKEDGTMYCPYRYKQWTDEQYNEACMKIRAKQQCMIDNNVSVLRSTQYNVYISYVEETYGKHYFKQFKMAKKKKL